VIESLLSTILFGFARPRVKYFKKSAARGAKCAPQWYNKGADKGKDLPDS